MTKQVIDKRYAQPLPEGRWYLPRVWALRLWVYRDAAVDLAKLMAGAIPLSLWLYVIFRDMFNVVAHSNISPPSGNSSEPLPPFYPPVPGNDTLPWHPNLPHTFSNEVIWHLFNTTAFVWNDVVNHIGPNLQQQGQVDQAIILKLNEVLDTNKQLLDWGRNINAEVTASQSYFARQLVLWGTIGVIGVAAIIAFVFYLRRSIDKSEQRRLRDGMRDPLGQEYYQYQHETGDAGAGRSQLENKWRARVARGRANIVGSYHRMGGQELAYVTKTSGSLLRIEEGLERPSDAEKGVQDGFHLAYARAFVVELQQFDGAHRAITIRADGQGLEVDNLQHQLAVLATAMQASVDNLLVVPQAGQDYYAAARAALATDVMARRTACVTSFAGQQGNVVNTVDGGVKESFQYAAARRLRLQLDTELSAKKGAEVLAEILNVRTQTLTPLFLERKWLYGLFIRDQELAQDAAQDTHGNRAGGVNARNPRLRALGEARWKALSARDQARVIRILLSAQQGEGNNGGEPAVICAAYAELARHLETLSEQSFTPDYYCSSAVWLTVLGSYTLVWSFIAYLDNPKASQRLNLLLAISGAFLVGAFFRVAYIRFQRRVCDADTIHSYLARTNQQADDWAGLDKRELATDTLRKYARRLGEIPAGAAHNAARQAVNLNLKHAAIAVMEMQRANAVPINVYQALYINGIDFQQAQAQEGEDRAKVVQLLRRIPKATNADELRVLFDAARGNNQFQGLLLRWYWGDPTVAEWGLPTITDKLRKKIYQALPANGQNTFTRANLFAPIQGVDQAHLNQWIGRCMVNSISNPFMGKSHFGVLSCYLADHAQQVGLGVSAFIAQCDHAAGNIGVENLPQIEARSALKQLFKLYINASSEVQPHLADLICQNHELRYIFLRWFWNDFNLAQWPDAPTLTHKQRMAIFNSFAGGGDLAQAIAQPQGWPNLTNLHPTSLLWALPNAQQQQRIDAAILRVFKARIGHIHGVRRTKRIGKKLGRFLAVADPNVVANSAAVSREFAALLGRARATELHTQPHVALLVPAGTDPALDPDPIFAHLLKVYSTQPNVRVNAVLLAEQYVISMRATHQRLNTQDIPQRSSKFIAQAMLSLWEVFKLGQAAPPTQTQLAASGLHTALINYRGEGVQTVIATALSEAFAIVSVDPVVTHRLTQGLSHYFAAHPLPFNGAAHVAPVLAALSSGENVTKRNMYLVLRAALINVPRFNAAGVVPQSLDRLSHFVGFLANSTGDVIRNEGGENQNTRAFAAILSAVCQTQTDVEQRESVLRMLIERCLPVAVDPDAPAAPGPAISPLTFLRDAIIDFCDENNGITADVVKPGDALVAWRPDHIDRGDQKRVVRLAIIQCLEHEDINSALVLIQRYLQFFGAAPADNTFDFLYTVLHDIEADQADKIVRACMMPNSQFAQAQKFLRRALMRSQFNDRDLNGVIDYTMSRPDGIEFDAELSCEVVAKTVCGPEPVAGERRAAINLADVVEILDVEMGACESALICALLLASPNTTTMEGRRRGRGERRSSMSNSRGRSRSRSHSRGPVSQAGSVGTLSPDRDRAVERALRSIGDTSLGHYLTTQWHTPGVSGEGVDRTTAVVARALQYLLRMQPAISADAKTRRGQGFTRLIIQEDDGGQVTETNLLSLIAFAIELDPAADAARGRPQLGYITAFLEAARDEQEKGRFVVLLILAQQFHYKAVSELFMKMLAQAFYKNSSEPDTTKVARLNAWCNQTLSGGPGAAVVASKIADNLGLKDLWRQFLNPGSRAVERRGAVPVVSMPPSPSLAATERTGLLAGQRGMQLQRRRASFAPRPAARVSVVETLKQIATRAVQSHVTDADVYHELALAAAQHAPAPETRGQRKRRLSWLREAMKGRSLGTTRGQLIDTAHASQAAPSQGVERITQLLRVGPSFTMLRQAFAEPRGGGVGGIAIQRSKAQATEIIYGRRSNGLRQGFEGMSERQTNAALEQAREQVQDALQPAYGTVVMHLLRQRARLQRYQPMRDVTRTPSSSATGSDLTSVVELIAVLGQERLSALLSNHIRRLGGRIPRQDFLTDLQALVGVIPDEAAAERAILQAAITAASQSSPEGRPPRAPRGTVPGVVAPEEIDVGVLNPVMQLGLTALEIKNLQGLLEDFPQYLLFKQEQEPRLLTDSPGASPATRHRFAKTIFSRWPQGKTVDQIWPHLYLVRGVKLIDGGARGPAVQFKGKLIYKTDLAAELAAHQAYLNVEDERAARDAEAQRLWDAINRSVGGPRTGEAGLFRRRRIVVVQPTGDSAVFPVSPRRRSSFGAMPVVRQDSISREEYQAIRGGYSAWFAARDGAVAEQKAAITGISDALRAKFLLPANSNDAILMMMSDMEAEPEFNCYLDFIRAQAPVAQGVILRRSRRTPPPSSDLWAGSGSSGDGAFQDFLRQQFTQWSDPSVSKELLKATMAHNVNTNGALLDKFQGMDAAGFSSLVARLIPDDSMQRQSFIAYMVETFVTPANLRRSLRK